MAERYCAPMCRICRAPGPRLCAASARAEEAELREEETDRVHDEFRASQRGPFRPPGQYVDRAEPWPHTRSGTLRDDPARSVG